MISNKRQRDYRDRRKERGEKAIQFYADPPLLAAIDDFTEKTRRPRSYVIIAILKNYLIKHGYKFEKAYLLDKPKKDVL